MSKFAELTTKKARLAYIREMVGSNEQWAIRGMLRIYERQTEDEQRSETTKYHNTIGFSGAHAEILSSFSKQVLAGRTMSEKQMFRIFKYMPRYARQLHDIAMEEQAK